jgi:hypothetical protein
MKRIPLLLLLVLAVGCGSEEMTTPPPGATVPTEPVPAETTPTETVPTETLPAEPSPKQLPAAVEATRQAIITAALARDYDALDGLIPESGFTFSYGGGERAVDYWKDLEAAGETPLATMAGILSLRHTRVGDIYVWPWAFDKNPANLTDAQKEQLAGAGAATVEQLDQMAEFGHYLGWRLGIRRDGTWIYFVAGD